MELERLQRAFREIDPRGAQVLQRRLLEDTSREACALLYGISAPAFDVMLWRACANVTAAVEARVPRLLPWDEERESARQLGLALATAWPLRDLRPQVSAVVSIAQAMVTDREPLLGALRRAELAEEARRANPRVELLRRLIFGLITAAALYWYWRYERPQAQDPPPPSAPVSRPGVRRNTATPSRVHP